MFLLLRPMHLLFSALHLFVTACDITFVMNFMILMVSCFRFHDAYVDDTISERLCSLQDDRRELYVPRTRTTMAMSRSFAVIAPSLWKRLPPSARVSLLSSNLSTSLSLLKTCLFSWS